MRGSEDICHHAPLPGRSAGFHHEETLLPDTGQEPSVLLSRMTPATYMRTIHVKPGKDRVIIDNRAAREAVRAPGTEFTTDRSPREISREGQVKAGPLLSGPPNRGFRIVHIHNLMLFE
ncbi:hypothetical protein Pve01_34190 [Planomonospora venezuelensis]|nr:hypothetical protein Pve01_34190 [Planomonospora venezuelensis]